MRNKMNQAIVSSGSKCGESTLPVDRWIRFVCYLVLSVSLSPCGRRQGTAALPAAAPPRSARVAVAAALGAVISLARSSRSVAGVCRR